MNLDLNDEQTLLLSAIAPLLTRYQRLPDPSQSVYFVYGAEFDSELEAAGFYGGQDGGELERADASLLLQKISESPYALPAMASLLIAPLITATTLPRPIALISAPPEVPVRFLGQARTALIVSGDKISMLDLTEIETTPADTIFGYPFARLSAVDRAKAVPLPAVSPERIRDHWRLGLGCEMLGAMRAAHKLTVDYVKQRVQFKRPIGSFQAVQHRLSECAMQIEALGLLLARAGWSGDTADIALATSYAQKTAAQLIYDCHQFHGAMGLTLEYVLHHWTYRLKILVGELGGASAQARQAALALWGPETTQ